MRLIVAGIGTDVGKTVVSAILSLALEADYWKPISTGGCPDRHSVESWTRRPAHREACALPDPVSPHAAARRVGIEITRDKMAPPAAERLVIEMCGGLLVPFNDREVTVDLFAQWSDRWVVVSRHYVGSINHTLLTLEALRRRGIEPMGICFNGESNPETERVICDLSKLPSVGRVGWERSVDCRMVERYAREWKEREPWKSLQS